MSVPVQAGAARPAFNIPACGSHSASCGNTSTATSTRNIAPSSHTTQGTVDSIGTRAMRHDTIRFTASGG